jgi:hypothetical protein
MSRVKYGATPSTWLYQSAAAATSSANKLIVVRPRNICGSVRRVFSDNSIVPGKVIIL